MRKLGRRFGVGCVHEGRGWRVGQKDAALGPMELLAIGNNSDSGGREGLASVKVVAYGHRLRSSRWERDLNARD